MTEQPNELAAARHDLKNVLTALRHGCVLVEARLDEAQRQELQPFLDEMRKSLAKGATIVDRLRSAEAALPVSSPGSPEQLG